MAEDLQISKSEFIEILKNRGSMYHLKLMMTHCLRKLNI